MESFSSTDFALILSKIESFTKTLQANKQDQIEQLRKLAEYLIYSEQHKGSFFEQFKTSNTQSHLLTILNSSNDKATIIQFLQTATLFVHNISSDSHKKYLISSNFLNTLISFSFDFTDEDTVDSYMSFLKGVSVNLSKSQLTKFLIQHNFSLFIGAMMFFNYKEYMIRTASRTVILNIIKLNNDAINDYVLDSGFLFSLSNHLWKVMVGMDQAFNEVGRIDGVWNEFEDFLYYINDIFEQESPEITEKLSNLLIRMLFPGLIGCFLQTQKPYFISQKLALWVLAKICEVVKGKSVVEAALVLIFKKEVNKALIQIVENSPPSVPPENFLISQDLNVENFVFGKIKELVKSSDSEQIFFLLLIIQGAIHNPAVSKDILSELGILSQKLLRNQKLVSRILQEDLPKTLNHNSVVLDMLFYLLQKESLITFFEYQTVCHIIFELTGSSTASLDPSHESILNETFVKKSLDLHESLNSQSTVQLIINLFKTEWNYVKNLNFHSVVAIPTIKTIKSGLGSLRKSSIESVITVEKFKIQENLRILFLIMKLKFITSQEEFPENPLNSSPNSKWVAGEYINTSNNHSDTIKYEKVKLNNSTVLIPDLEHQFLILEYSKDLFPLCPIKMVHNWTDLKIGVNHSACTVKISITDSPTSYNLQLCSRDDTQSLLNFLKPKMKFALSIETQLIRSFFEDYYQRL